MIDTVQISFSDLQDLAANALIAVGVPEGSAVSAAEVMATADLIGIDTHGTQRLAPYVARLRDGVFNSTPKLSTGGSGTASIVVDGDNGLGPVVGSYAMDVALERVVETGSVFVTSRNSQHIGALAPYAMRAARAGMVCFLGTNAFPTMAPWGGRDIKVGNNPLGLGAPRRGAAPFILDTAMSVAARGKMRQAKAKGEKIPEGWALDACGKPTTDPAEGLNGYVLPVGGHKGYGLALAVDILSGVLSGGAVSTEVKSLFKQTDKPQSVCHFLFLIDPAQTMGTESYFDRMEALCTLIKDTEPFDPENPVLLPGEIEARHAEQGLKSGIQLTSKFLETLHSLARGEAPRNVATS